MSCSQGPGGSGKELTGAWENFFGVTEIFYIITVDVATCLYTFVQNQRILRLQDWVWWNSLRVKCCITLFGVDIIKSEYFNLCTKRFTVYLCLMIFIFFFFLERYGYVYLIVVILRLFLLPEIDHARYYTHSRTLAWKIPWTEEPGLISAQQKPICKKAPENPEGIIMFFSLWDISHPAFLPFSVQKLLWPSLEITCTLFFFFPPRNYKGKTLKRRLN